ncbi:MAG: twin-arginine translocase TatA/TatE family subunit [Sulfurospirillum sp.]|nr:twin-arginine translocase TatA/TatE family subunit [Sulfurospirillum sp.]
MFGLGFSEILVIAIIAILFLGPEKLPDAMVKGAKFFKSFKKQY